MLAHAEKFDVTHNDRFVVFHREHGVVYEFVDRDMVPAANLSSRKLAMQAGLHSLRKTTGEDFGYDVELWREYLVATDNDHGYTHPWAYSEVNAAGVAALDDPDVIATLDSMSIAK